jgi:hypothetical protein
MKKVQSRVYRKIYEEHHNIKIPKRMHIHHLDGNRQNNNPKNLPTICDVTYFFYS